MEQRRKLKVVCNIPNGVTLNIHEAGRGELGQTVFAPIGSPVELRPGSNSVDEDFVQRWIEQNRNSDLIVNGLLTFPDINRKDFYRGQ